MNQYQPAIRKLLNLSQVRLFLLVILFVDILLISIELLISIYISNIKDPQKQEEFEKNLKIIEITTKLLLLILNFEWILYVMAYGYEFLKKCDHLFNALICLTALILCFSVKGNKELEAIMVLMAIRLVRLIITIHEISVQIDEKIIEELKEKYEKMESLYQEEVIRAQELLQDIQNAKNNLNKVIDQNQKEVINLKNNIEQVIAQKEDLQNQLNQLLQNKVKPQSPFKSILK